MYYYNNAAIMLYNFHNSFTKSIYGGSMHLILTQGLGSKKRSYGKTRDNWIDGLIDINVHNVHLTVWLDRDVSEINDWLIDWLVSNANISSIAAISWRDLNQLSMQAGPIITNVVSSNPSQAMCTRCNIMW
jgi:hypothetical protein